MNNKKRKNFFVIDKESFYETNSPNIKKVVEILNSNRLVIINGLKNIGKINFIKEFISKTKLNKNYFYFNKSDDYENKVSSNKDLEHLFNEYIKLYKEPKIVILQDISKIEKVQEFITSIYKQNFKIILVGNDIKIANIKEVEIYANIEINHDNYEHVLMYGSINEIKEIENDDIKERMLILMRNDIFLNEIFKNFGVKSIDLYFFVVSFMAGFDKYISMRELHKTLDEIQGISLKTAIDYIDFSVQEKILKRVYKYDLKDDRIITSKAKYYFSDNGIRNSLAFFNLDKHILIENLIFNIIETHDYNIYSGFNGKFDVTFYGEKDVKDNLGNETKEKIYVHMTNQKSKDEIKKEVNRLLKIGEEGKKYLVVNNLDNTGLKKYVYDSVEVLDSFEFIERFTQK